jgi:peptidoglycan hydrolase-like protein with peptidoglycan-binding domain
MRLQMALNHEGFDVGTPDGVLGRKTRSALRQYQKAHGLAADGFPTAALLDGLEKQ